MLDLDTMFDCEVRFPVRFSEVSERDYGLLFHNEDNSDSYDSNHAVILRLDVDLEAALEDITAFYSAIGMKARLYPGFQSGEVDRLKPILDRHGFTFESCCSEYLLLRNASTLRPNPGVQIRRITEVDDTVAELIRATEGSDRSIKVLQRHLRWDEFYCQVGYVDGRAVTIVSFEEMGECSRGDVAMTHPEFRGRGYFSALVHDLVGRYRTISRPPLYAWTDNPVAAGIYRRAGFVDLPIDRPMWSAWLE